MKKNNSPPMQTKSPAVQAEPYVVILPSDQDLSQEYTSKPFDPVEEFGDSAGEAILNALEQKTQEIPRLDWEIASMRSIIPTLPDGNGITLKLYYQVALPRVEAQRSQALRHLRRLEKQYDQFFKTNTFKRAVPKYLVDTQQLKEQTDIVSVVEQYLELRPAGGGKYKARCPFHSDKTPSLIVYPDHFHCYGCQEHGDVISFLERINNMDFKAAVNELGGMI